MLDTTDRAHQIVLLNHADTLALFPLDLAIEAVEAAYRAHATGSAQLFPVVRERLEEGAVCGIKSGYWPEAATVGLKVAGLWPHNQALGLDAHQATVVLCDATTGRLRALINGNVITTLRTAAAGAIGLHTLARPDACRAAILGAGVQAHAQAKALRAVYPTLRSIHIWARQIERAQRFAADLESQGWQVSVKHSADEAVHECDIVITTTPSTRPLFSAESIAPGTHINAMGADTQGKRELPVELVQRAVLIVDDRDQARALGESQPPVTWSEPPATIGEILIGAAVGRTTTEAITVFDSTGIGLQDVMAGVRIYEQAQQSGTGLWLPWA